MPFGDSRRRIRTNTTRPVFSSDATQATLHLHAVETHQNEERVRAVEYDGSASKEQCAQPYGKRKDKKCYAHTHTMETRRIKFRLEKVALTAVGSDIRPPKLTDAQTKRGKVWVHRLQTQ